MTFRKWAVAAAGALSLAACSQGDQQASDTASPEISPTAAPGVAFEYAYDFRLSDDRIDDAQEAQASACEKLGVQRCRITGLRYSIDKDDQVSAMLQVKLDPAIARAFGKAAVANIEESGGQLVTAEFTGTDEGEVIRESSGEKSDLQRRIADLESRLASRPSGDRERAELQRQLDELRAQVAQAGQKIAASQDRLASTPMTFNYYGKGGVPGFHGKNPVRDAWHAFAASAVTLVSVLLYAIGALLPWVLLLLLIVLLIRSRVGYAIGRWWRSTSYRRPEDE